MLETDREQEQGTRQRPPALRGRITLEDVSFHYSPVTPPVVAEASVDLLPGQLVAIVGALGTLLFLHAEMNQFTRVIVFIVMGIGTLVGANAFLSGSGAQGAEVTGTPKTSHESYAPRPQYPDPSRR